MSTARAVASKGSAKKARGGREHSRQAQLAHDLGNSLGAVSLHLQVLGASAGSPAQREGIEAAKRQIRTAAVQLAELRRLIRES